MQKYFCRYLNCNMSFSSNQHAKGHENIMHKEMIKESAIILLDKIIKNNSDEKLNKKIIKTKLGNFSYKEAKEKIDNQEEDGKAILEVLKNVILTYFEQYPDYGMKEIIKISDFRIK